MAASRPGLGECTLPQVWKYVGTQQLGVMCVGEPAGDSAVKDWCG